MKTPQEILDLYYLPPDMYGNFKIMQAMEDYADQFKMKWIPVTERLPERNGRYWVAFKYNEPSVAEFRDCVWYDHIGGYVHPTTSILVTHWMPLPEKPS